MSEKRVLGRTVAIGLGIVCIILAVGLVGAIAGYASIISGKENVIATRDSQIASLNSQVTNLTNQLNSLNNTVKELRSMLNLEKYTYWAWPESIPQAPNSYLTWSAEARYAGYIKVNVVSNESSTYVRVFYSSHVGVNYDNQIVVGAGNNSACFPVLPAFSVNVSVGNTNLSNGALIFVTIIYYY